MTKGTTSSALNGLARLAANSKACSELDEKSTGTTMRLNFIAHLLDDRQSKTRAAAAEWCQVGRNAPPATRGSQYWESLPRMRSRVPNVRRVRRCGLSESFIAMG